MASMQEVKEMQKGTQATFSNQVPTQMNLARSERWAGFGSFPTTISPNNSSIFTHLSTPGGSGSVAAVQYDGITPKGVECAWIVAWKVPAIITPKTRNKVYATCGPKSTIDAITWDEIADKLELFVIPDPTPGPVGVYATISDPAPDFATLLARFYVN